MTRSLYHRGWKWRNRRAELTMLFDGAFEVRCYALEGRRVTREFFGFCENENIAEKVALRWVEYTDFPDFSSIFNV